ncbi:hypothetical protein F5Y10DRAFT_98382 [Nemania abortiva]|nr:hypothetical protein F5Y10DRAFT_98382 [Nemania abortiva]
MELDAHQMTPWAYGYHVRRPHDFDMSGRPRHPPPAASAPSSPPSRCTLTRNAPRSVDGSIRNPCDGGRPGALGLDTRSGSKSWPPSPKSHSPPQKEARQHEPPPPSRTVKAGTIARERLGKEKTEEEKREERRAIASPARPTATGAVATEFQFSLPFRQQNMKRIRTPDDVDGPGTAGLAVKKRRLLLRLVTSRLSRPFSLPATHILIRESGDNMPVLHRIQQLAATTLGARRAGHQSALVRKAAILNRVRIGVRQAAVSRGHTIMADLAARGNALDHGLLLVTTPAAGAMGAMFPVVGRADGGNATPRGVGLGSVLIPPVWRPHTTSFHPPIGPGHQQQHGHNYNYSYSYGVGAMNRVDMRHTSTSQVPQTSASATTHHIPRAIPPRHKESRVAEPAWSAPRQHDPPPVLHLHPHPHPHPHHTPAEISDEEDNTAFPAASFRDRYADLSDDDMDDVYADFGVLFGSGGARSPEARAAGPAGPVEEQFYEEYLDELDGIPWIA